jgi:hypothetical protein
MPIGGSSNSSGAADSTGYGGRGIPTGLFIQPSPTPIASQLRARAMEVNAAADAKRLAAAHAASMAAFQRASQIAALQKSLNSSKGSVDTPAPSPPPAKDSPSINPADIYATSINPADVYATAQKIAQGYLAPQLQYVNQQTNLGKQAIAGFTNDFLNKLLGTPGAPGLSNQIGSDYNRAIAEQSALSDAISASLGGQAKDQSALLAAVNAPAAAANQLNQTEAGFQRQGNVLAGVGGLTASSLVGEKAAQQAMARELPSIVQLGGQQALGRFLTQQALAKSQIASQIPTQVSQIASSIMQNQASVDKNNALLALGLGKLTVANTKTKDAAATSALKFISGLKNRTQTVTGKSGKSVTTANPAGYNAAIQQTQSAYPQLSTQEIIDKVNSVYRWGNGRALLTSQRQALVGSGLSPDVSFDSAGRPFLTLQQASALNKAGVLTPDMGQVGSDGNFYLAG